MEYLGLSASFAMGIILGLMGGGGSILTVPILVYLFAMAPTIATGHSLFVVGVTALIGSLLAMRRNEIDFRAGLAFAIPSVLGVNLSRGFILPRIPEVLTRAGGFTLTKEVLVMMAFAVLMVAASFSMLKKGNERGSMTTSASNRFALIAVGGLIVGMIAGFVGAGGGFLTIPALVIVVDLPMRVAVGTSLMIIAVQSLFGFAGDVLRGMPVEWSLLGPIAAFAVVGIVAGSAIAHRIKERKLKTAFGWFVLVMGFAILFEQLRHLST